MQAPQTFYDVASARLDDQLQNVDALDAKVGTALGFSAALLPITTFRTRCVPDGSCSKV